LNADDRLVAQMAASCAGRVIYISAVSTNPVIAAHLADGGRCVYLDCGAICLQEGEQKTELVEVADLPFTAGGRIAFQVANALAATAAAWGAGLNPALIVRALSTFRTDAQLVPGRFNLMMIGEIEVILDYGHNRAAMEGLAQAVGALGTRRTVMVIGLPGDRRDEDLVRTLQPTVSFADEYFLHDLEDRRGRKPGEVPALLQSHLPHKTPSAIVENQRVAIQQAWRSLRAGDRLVIIADIVDEALNVIKSLSARDDDADCSVRCVDSVLQA
jgi:cyanophycin synthetase